MREKKPKMSRGQAQRYLDEYNRRCGTHYQIGEACGSGVLGSVFRIRGTQPAMVVKISEDRGKPQYRKLCKNEIRIMEQLGNHPNIVPLLDSLVLSEPVGCYESGTQIWGDVYLLFMPEYLSLGDWLRRKRALNERELCRMAMELCQALMDCQRKQVLHRDLKPGNIFVEAGKEEPGFLLGDYNVARFFTEADTGPITRLGTDGFASPEIMLCAEDRAQLEQLPPGCELEPGCFNSDVYGLGITLYYLITDSELPSLRYRTGAFHRTLEGISEEFERIIWKAVRFLPAERYAQAADMLAQLQRLSTDEEQAVCQDSCFLWAKEALLGRKWTVAEDLALMGIGQGDTRCSRLRAYCRYIRLKRQLRAQTTAGEPMARAHFREQTMLLQMELQEDYQESRDAASLFLSALISLDRGEAGEFYRHAQTAAEQGYAPAQFFCGKLLCEQQADRAGGYPLLIAAAEADFPAALRYVKKYEELGNLPGIGGHISGGLRCSMTAIRVDGKADIFGDMIRFL